jgi:hypothetical protein
VKFSLAAEIQNRLVGRPPPGWTARREVSLLDADATRILGYRPAVDLLLESRHTDERLWLELEISRADPVANHAKFASAHLMQPLSERDTFVSLVSNHVARGRANLAAHAIHLLRIAGLKAFQIPLLPELDGKTIMALNQGEASLEDLPDLEICEIIDLTRPVAPGDASRIYYATNALEVLLNLQQWNRDMTHMHCRTAWGRRRIRYLVAHPASGLFAPSKFCAYTRMPSPNDSPGFQTPAMTVPAYARIEPETGIFDGQKARLRLERLGFRRMRISDCTPSLRQRFASWLEFYQGQVNVDMDSCEFLVTGA